MSRFPAIAAALLFPLIAACADRPFEQLSYFKDDRRNRILVYRAVASSDIDAVRNHAADLTHTPGQFTQAFYYLDPDAEIGDPVTMATSYSDALDILFDGPSPAWQARAVIGPSGALTVTDCISDPDPGSCK